MEDIGKKTEPSKARFSQTTRPLQRSTDVPSCRKRSMTSKRKKGSAERRKNERCHIYDRSLEGSPVGANDHRGTHSIVQKKGRIRGRFGGAERGPFIIHIRSLNEGGKIKRNWKEVHREGRRHGRRSRIFLIKHRVPGQRKEIVRRKDRRKGRKDRPLRQRATTGGIHPESNGR